MATMTDMVLKVKITISLWDAIKIRIAGHKIPDNITIGDLEVKDLPGENVAGKEDK